jgi:hypothetical protein
MHRLSAGTGGRSGATGAVFRYRQQDSVARLRISEVSGSRSRIIDPLYFKHADDDDCDNQREREQDTTRLFI